IGISQIDAFAATSGPGLASSLMTGASIAKGLAIGFGQPYLAINHLEGHLLSPFFGETEIKPNVSLVVSGGHTMSIFVRGVGEYEVIGRTVDDAAGEAFDKIAKLLGLGYPGGPEIERCAAKGDSKRFDLPRSMPESENFSFSGLKTAVRYLLPTLGGDFLADVCASVQQAIVDVLVRKTIAAAKKFDVDLVTVSGGVSCNRELRKQLSKACKGQGVEFKTAEAWLCTDNAAMIAFAALFTRLGHIENVVDHLKRETERASKFGDRIQLFRVRIGAHRAESDRSCQDCGGFVFVNVTQPCPANLLSFAFEIGHLSSD